MKIVVDVTTTMEAWLATLETTGLFGSDQSTVASELLRIKLRELYEAEVWGLGRDAVRKREAKVSIRK